MESFNLENYESISKKTPKLLLCKYAIKLRNQERLQWLQMISTDRLGGKEAWRTVSQIPQKCKETSNLMWLSIVWFISVLFVYWNLFCTIANLRIKWVTKTKNGSVLFYKNVKSSILRVDAMPLSLKNLLLNEFIWLQLIF